MLVGWQCFALDFIADTKPPPSGVYRSVHEYPHPLHVSSEREVEGGRAQIPEDSPIG